MSRAFTLLELLLSMAIIAIVTAVGAPIYAQFQVRSDATTAKQIVVQAARRAQSLTWSGRNSANWGVKIQTGSVTVFSGASYSARDAALDENYSVSPSLTWGGASEIIYQLPRGTLASDQTVALTSLDGETRTIYLNQNGSVW